MSDVTIRVPTPLRSFTGGADEVAVQGGTVGEALEALGTTTTRALPPLDYPRYPVLPANNQLQKLSR